MFTTEAGLLVLAGLFAIVNGVNDGGALIALSSSVRGLPRVLALLMLTLAVVVVPLTVGTQVATTLTSRLVSGGGAHAQLVLVSAAGAAILVSALLALRGLPTSLTLALVGGLSGAALGAGLEVAWSTLGTVLLVAGLAPAIGLAVAVALSWLARWVPVPEGVPRRVRWLHVLGFAGVCAAYGANDGQKMLALFALASAGLASATAEGASVQPDPVLLVAIAACFALGTVLGMSRFAGTVVGGIVPARPDAAVTTELSSAAVVLTTGAVGAPVSMTQAVSGALVGTGVSGGRRSVRWRLATRMAWAWVITLPVAFGVSALVGLGLLALSSAL